MSLRTSGLVAIQIQISFLQALEHIIKASSIFWKPVQAALLLLESQVYKNSLWGQGGSLIKKNMILGTKYLKINVYLHIFALYG